VAAVAGPRLHEHLDFGALHQERLRIGAAQIALGERRALGELAGRREVLVRDVDVATRLEHEQLHRRVADHRFVSSTDYPAMGDAGWHDDIVAGVDRQAAEHALEHGVAGLDVD
jgi:hypothetical protein